MAWWQRHFGGTTRGRLVALLRRGRHSVEELAVALGVTDNAVRAQLVALERDGIVHAVGVRREGAVGKPATVYGIAPGADALFSTAYAPLLAAVLAALGDRFPPREVEAVLCDAGRHLGRSAAPGTSGAATFDDRVRGAAAYLAGLGADADLIATPGGYEIRSHGCPVGQAVAARPETCHALEQLLAEVTGAPVTEFCDRTGAPRCHFVVSRPGS